MNKFESVTKPLRWLMALLLVAVMAGCGDGGSDPILGGGGAGGAGAIPGAPGGAIIPGAVCSAASGPTIPTVTFSNPVSGDQSVPTSTSGVANGGKTVTATFSLGMAPATINTTTFTLAPVGQTVLIPASVTYNTTTKIATLTTSSALLANTSYTAIITKGVVTSATGTAIACSYAWNFKTATAVPLAINLRGASTFGIASRAGMTSSGVTVVNGDIGLFPNATCTDATGNGGAAQTCITPSGLYVSPTGMTVNGTIYYNGDPFDNGGTANSITNDLNIAWTEGKNKVDTFATSSLSGQLAGKTLVPGVYHETVLNLAVGGICQIDAANNPNAIFIIKVDTDFTDSGIATTPTRINLINGAQARNVWFVIGGAATIGTGTTWNGNILAGGTLTISGGSTTVTGRLLAGAAGAGAFTMTTGAPLAPPITITVPQ